MEQEIKNDTRYRFKTEEDYLDFLKTAENQGFKWSSGREPTEFAEEYKKNAKTMYINTEYGRLTYSTYFDERTTQVEYWDRKEEENKGDKKMKSNKEYKVILNDPAVILFKYNPFTMKEDKYVSKAHNEPFDPEKGLLMCLAKANGISHLDLKRILKNAKNQKKNSEVEKFKDISKEIENIKNDNPNNNIASIDINGITYTVNKTALTKVYTKEPSRSYPPEEYTEPETILISPKGRHRGQPFKFMVGDKCIVRDCNYYKYTTNAKAKECLNQIFTITEDKSDFAGSMYVVNGVEFSGAELEPVVK